MRILLLGATGRVGQSVLQYALHDGHEVTVLVRSLDKLNAQLEEYADKLVATYDSVSDIDRSLPISEQLPNLHVHVGDVLSSDDLYQALDGVEAVMSTLNTDKTTTLSVSTPILVDLMQKKSIARIITVGTAGILQSRIEADKYRYESSESKRKSTRAAEEHRMMYETLRDSGLDWTVVCPTYLPEGEYTGVYRDEQDVLPEDGTSISTGDTAYFTYQQLSDLRYIGHRVGLAY
ncbi:NAD(P)H-binding protein [Paenibacillus kyungheensis]|uniref:NAD(P)H-binding protein n=1 Tax=Paenibacillus kyungheensis TaxID=1452732 RepID=A0AAX3M0H5_9BACL|nr:NAD(P)H-binding protein [Paenibacillus kyungheensis]WCT55715.1 NAD(P)H-binding protein [Paenibacillus kyungheensis]